MSVHGDAEWERRADPSRAAWTDLVARRRAAQPPVWPLRASAVLSLRLRVAAWILTGRTAPRSL